jgi:hypothetical protein
MHQENYSNRLHNKYLVLNVYCVSGSPDLKILTNLVPHFLKNNNNVETNTHFQNHL